MRLLLLPCCCPQAAPASQDPAPGLLGAALQDWVLQWALEEALLPTAAQQLLQGCAATALLLRRLCHLVAGNQPAQPASCAAA